VLHADSFKGIVVFLVVAGVIVPLFHRARLSTVLGFLIAGAALGPHGLGRLAPQYPWIDYITFSDPDHGKALAEFGIIVLLFLLGMELSLRKLWELRRYVLGVGVAQVLLTTVAIGVTVRLLGGVPPSGVILGLCLALSSTAIVMQILTEQHRVASPTGRIALSVLLFQDLMVVPILFVVGILAGGGEGGVVRVGWLIAQALAAVLVLMLAGRYLLGPLLRSAVRTGSRDLIMAITLLIVVAFAGATGLAGLSVALGAFLAGLLLSDSEARHHIEVDLEPFKGLLLGIFFITVGATLDIAGIVVDGHWIALAVIVLMTGKAAIMFGVARAFGVPRGVAAETALLLSQAGEFAFVVIGVAGSLLPPRVAAGAVTAVCLSMLLTPLAAWLGRLLAKRLERGEHSDHAPGTILAELDNHVVIGGCGRVGQLIAQVLEKENVPYVCLDTDGDNVARMRGHDRPVYFGDAARSELLEKVGGRRARAFVVTLNDARAAERMVSAARRVNRGALIFARAADTAHAARLVKRGAFGVIPETVEASLQLAGRLLEVLDVPDDVVALRLSELRAAEVAKLDEAEIKEMNRAKASG
jgi:CPA2 family monovalent cation:H+ antiporter-2